MLGYQLTPVVKILLLINVGAFLILGFAHLPGLSDNLALYYFTSDNFRIYQIITHIFMHGSFGHLFGNMFALFMFGPALERVWGSQKFIIYYFICGIGASLLYTGVQAYEFEQLKNKINAYKADPDPYTFDIILDRNFQNYKPMNPEIFINMPLEMQKNPEDKQLIRSSFNILDQLYEAKINIPMVGASGAIFGILLGFGMLFPNTILMLLIPPIPIKAKYFVMLFGLLELYLGIQNNPTDSVAHFAHVGGMLFGYIMIMYWRNRRDRFY